MSEKRVYEVLYVEDLLKQIERLEGDNDHLTKSDRVWLEANQRKDREIERLEAALREIEELPPEHTRAYVSQDIARAALNDNDDVETFYKTSGTVNGMAQMVEAKDRDIERLEAVLQHFYDYGYDRGRCEEALDGEKEQGHE